MPRQFNFAISLSLRPLSSTVDPFCKRNSKSYSTARVMSKPKPETDILDFILRRLSFADCLTFSKVCRRWRTVFLHRSRLSSPPPCLLLRPNISVNFTEQPFWSLNDGNLLKLSSPRPKFLLTERIVGFSMDWLVIASTIVPGLQLLNPISNQRISLPPLASGGIPMWYNKSHQSGFSIFHVRLSTTPTSADCVLVAFGHLEVHGHVFALCRSGYSEWITTFLPHMFTINETIIHNGELYILGTQGKILVYTLNPQAKFENIISDINNDSFYCKKFVTSGEELFLVGLKVNSINGSHIDTVEIYKLDKHLMDGWSRVDSLGDRVLLMGISNAQLYRPKDLLGSGFEENCVYYSGWWRSNELVKFSLTTKSSQTIPLPPHDPNTLFGIEWITTRTW